MLPTSVNSDCTWLKGGDSMLYTLNNQGDLVVETCWTCIHTHEANDYHCGGRSMWRECNFGVPTPVNCPFFTPHEDAHPCGLFTDEEPGPEEY